MERRHIARGPSRSWKITESRIKGVDQMPTFKHVALVGSEDLFRPTRPEVVTDTDDVIKGTVDRPGKAVKEVVYKTLNFKLEEIELQLEAVQTAKYPERPQIGRASCRERGQKQQV